MHDLNNYLYLQNRTIPGFDSPEQDDPYALILVVNDDKSHIPEENDVYQASMEAVLTLLGDTDESVRESVNAWLDGRIRKIVKRARNKQWDDTTEVDGHSEAVYGTAKVRAFPPVRLSEQPAVLKKLQVTGLNANRSENPSTAFSGLRVLVNQKLNMSVGKTVAQINHATQLFIMTGDPAKIESWFKQGNPIQVAFHSDLDDVVNPDSEVHDAGFTEVEPGSKTVVAIFV
jgi:hypothetical protein